MTKRELIEALEQFPDNAQVDVRIPADGRDRLVDGVVDFIINDQVGWITLGLV